MLYAVNALPVGWAPLITDTFLRPGNLAAFHLACLKQIRLSGPTTYGRIEPEFLDATRLGLDHPVVRPRVLAVGPQFAGCQEFKFHQLRLSTESFPGTGIGGRLGSAVYDSRALFRDGSERGRRDSCPQDGFTAKEQALPPAAALPA